MLTSSERKMLHHDIAAALDRWVSSGHPIFYRHLGPTVRRTLHNKYQGMLLDDCLSASRREGQKQVGERLFQESLEYLKEQGYQPGHFLDGLGYGYGWGRSESPHSALYEW